MCTIQITAMKKLIVPILLLAIVAISCSDKHAYSVSTTLQDNSFDGQTVYLQKFDNGLRKYQSIDSCKVENQQFEFNGIASDTPTVHILRMEQPFLQALFIAEPGKISITVDSIGMPFVNGTPLNDEYQALMNTFQSSVSEGRNFRMRINQAAKDGKVSKELYAEYLSKLSRPDAFTSDMFEFIKSTIKNPVGEYFLLEYTNMFKLGQLKELLSVTTPQFRETEVAQRMEKRIAALENTDEGKPFVDFKGKDLNGKEISLSDYAGKGKIVLVDFWASWCNPCIASLPSLSELRKKFSNKDFEIIGVSLDTDKQQWEDASKKYQVTWPQICTFQDEKHNEAERAYGVSFIPHTILIDKNGLIVEKDFINEFLSFKIEELLARK